MDASIYGAIPSRWLTAIEYLNKPANPQKIAMEVTRLRTLTAKRAESEFDLELSIGAITEELSVYPLDVAASVCRDWARTNKWFPTLAELIERCEALMIERRALLAAASIVEIAPEANENNPDEREPRTPENLQKVDSIMTEIMKNLGATRAA